MENNFESMFRVAVESMNGEILPEGDAESADFLFRQSNVAAELKTLEEDARKEYAAKLEALIQDWMKRRLLIAFGRNVIELGKVHPTCQREWLGLLQGPVEGLLRKANRQIRSSKEAAKLEDARGLLIIANDGNFLHTSPVDYMTLVARVLQKKKPSGELQFPHIRGVIYMSYRVPTHREGMPFWVGGVLDQSVDGTLHELQQQLKAGWYEYLEKKTGVRITEMPLSLEKQ
jgi:hypothetical protein